MTRIYCFLRGFKTGLTLREEMRVEAFIFTQIWEQKLYHLAASANDITGFNVTKFC